MKRLTLEEFTALEEKLKAEYGSGNTYHTDSPIKGRGLIYKGKTYYFPSKKEKITQKN